jgi:hypothetical protein
MIHNFQAYIVHVSDTFLAVYIAMHMSDMAVYVQLWPQHETHWLSWKFKLLRCMYAVLILPRIYYSSIYTIIIIIVIK